MSYRDGYYVLAVAALLPVLNLCADEVGSQAPFFKYVTGAATMVTYTPSELDPRQEANQQRLTTSSIRADLVALRPAFYGLILYGYHEATTARILAVP